MSAALQSLMHAEPRQRRAKTQTIGSLAAFLVVGGAGAAAFVLLSTIVVALDTGLAVWAVSALCYGALIVPIYLLHRRFVFGSEAAHGQALPRYVAVQGMALVLAALFSFVLNGAFEMPSAMASVLVIGLTSAVNFLLLRSWAFMRRPAAVPAIA